MTQEERSVPDVFLVTSEGGVGLTRKQTRGQSFVTTSRGVRVRRELVESAGARASAAIIACRDDAVLSDVSAARWWGLPLPPWIGLEPGPVAVAVPAAEARPKRSGVRGRRLLLPADHVTEHRGRRVTIPSRTWIDCSPLVPFAHLVAMGDAALRVHLSDVNEMKRMVDWAKRRRGILAARRAVPILDAAAESPGESLARVALVTGGIPAPRCNLDIYCGGEWLARADMAWEDAHVIAEYDGAVHSGNRQRQYDAARRNLLQDAGWTVIVFTSRDLKHPQTMCTLVAGALRAGRLLRHRG